MSTDYQQLSIPNQQAAIRHYAMQRGLTIVRSYADEGKSGLSLHGRDALVNLLTDVQSPQRDFDVILVFDVSRWGRFQDVDEAGYYEFLCRKSGVQVHYCAEQFTNEPGPLTTIIKSIKRMMAAEFSRELSLRTSLSMRRLVTQGYLPGGAPGYGLRRMLVAPDGTHKGILGRGEWKSMKNDRIMLVPGPDNEVATVRRIFDLFVHKHHSRTEIAGLLNADGIPNPHGKDWEYQNVYQVLRSERYAGVIVYSRTGSKLSAGNTDNRLYKNPPHLWVRGHTGYGELVSKEVVAAALAAPSMKGYRYRDDEALLKPLRALLKTHGYLSHDIILASPTAPAPPTLRTRFGSLRAAYERLGYKGGKHFATRFNRSVRTLANKVMEHVATRALEVGKLDRHENRYRRVYLTTGKYITVSVAQYKPICRAQRPRWVTNTYHHDLANISLVVRLDTANRGPLDYFCLPGHLILHRELTISAAAGMYDEWRYDNIYEAISSALAA
jgi:DNA invertase Pin-like site-specific DNA recombinase